MFNSRDTKVVKSIYDDEYRTMIERLVETRTAKGMTQLALAERLGWERTIINKIENCVRRIDVIETLKICRALGIRLPDVIDL